jgi:CheY-like chemotaxis protein
MSEPSESAQTVLVVDDDAMFQMVLVGMLEVRGYRALVAAEGSEALRMLQEQGPKIDAVVADLNMRPMNGRQFLAQLRLLSPDMPVVMMSGSAKEDVPEAAKNASFPSFIQKPFTSEAIARAIRAASAAGAAR